MNIFQLLSRKPPVALSCLYVIFCLSRGLWWGTGWSLSPLLFTSSTITGSLMFPQCPCCSMVCSQRYCFLFQFFSQFFSEHFSCALHWEEVDSPHTQQNNQTLRGELLPSILHSDLTKDHDWMKADLHRPQICREIHGAQHSVSPWNSEVVSLSWGNRLWFESHTLLRSRDWILWILYLMACVVYELPSTH